jgi:serine phosphatase RsbU (regulator of sigma subunit)
VGDVVGHGPEAARLATFIRARFAAFVANTSDPGELLSLANLALIDRPGPDHELVSAVCLRGANVDLKLRTGSTALDTGEGVIAYTDGATDVRQDGVLLGLDGFTRLVKPLVLLPASALAGQAEGAILEWTDEPLSDDLCLLVVRPKRH